MTKFKKALATLMAVACSVSAFYTPVSVDADDAKDDKVLESGYVDIDSFSTVYAQTNETYNISSNYTWKSQGNTEWCWAVVGSHVLSYAFGNISTEDVVISKYGNANNPQATGSNDDVGNYFDTLQEQNNTSHTWHNISASTSTFTRIKAAIGNGKPVAIRIEYTEDDETKSHEILCLGYEITSTTKKLYFYDSQPSSASEGKYWSGSYNTSTNKFNTSRYGTCTFKSGYFITKN